MQNPSKYKNRVKFTVNGEPTGKGRPRFSYRTGRAATPEKTVLYENLVKTEYAIQTKNYRFPDDAQLDLRITAYYGIPKSKSKKARSKMLFGQVRPTKKPDMDNVIKVIADALNNVAYHDDSQVVECQCRKFYSELPRVEIIIQELNGEVYL